jgi:hypothetical protein
MDEIISYKMCAVKVRNAKLRNYLKGTRWRRNGIPPDLVGFYILSACLLDSTKPVYTIAAILVHVIMTTNLL